MARHADQRIQNNVVKGSQSVVVQGPVCVCARVCFRAFASVSGKMDVNVLIEMDPTPK